jgi:hypothetical protein
MMNKIVHWFYSTWLGGKYLEFLLWKDEANGNKLDITPQEVQQIIIEAQQMLYREGISNIKKRVNSIVNARTKEEYDQKLKELEDLIPLAVKEDDKLRDMRKALNSIYVKKGKDVKNSTDFARMIDTKIEYTKQLWKHREKRELLRSIRKAKVAGEVKRAEELEKEFFEKYVRQS